MAATVLAVAAVPAATATPAAAEAATDRRSSTVAIDDAGDPPAVSLGRRSTAAGDSIFVVVSTGNTGFRLRASRF
jgi:hypothetical protein